MPYLRKKGEMRTDYMDYLMENASIKSNAGTE